MVKARAWTVAVGLLLAGCSASGGQASTSTPPASTSSAASTTSSTSSPSTTMSSESVDEKKAGDAVVAFYKELDLVAQGKARLDSFRHATTDGVDTTTTLPKWQGLLSNQLLAGNVQVGKTVVELLATEAGEKAKAGGASWPSWIVTACVDRSGVHLEKDGKADDSSAPAREIVTHVVVDVEGDFAVVRDDPGKSC